MKSSFAPVRKHLRVAWRMPLAIQIVRDGSTVPAVTFNISAGGLLAFCSRSLDDDLEVAFALDLPDGRTPQTLDVRGNVVRHETNSAAMVAIAFKDLSSAEAARLRHCVVNRALTKMLAIAEFPAFWNLADLDLLSLASVCHELHLTAGSSVARHGDEAHSVFLVKRGAVQLRAPFTRNGVSTEVEVARAGQVFGEVSALLGLPHNLDVVAIEPTELLVIPRDALLYLRDYNPNLAVCLYEIFAAFMGRRVRKLTGRLISPLSY